jgi:hypothetical protein
MNLYTPRQRGKVMPEVLFDFVEGAVKVRDDNGEWIVAPDDYVLRPSWMTGEGDDG